MINTRGYYYLNQINPTHNITTKKPPKIDNTHNITNRHIQYMHKYNKDDNNINIGNSINNKITCVHANNNANDKQNRNKDFMGIIGKGYNDNQNIQPIYKHRNTQHKITFEKLQHILNRQTSEHKRNPQTKQLHQKNSYENHKTHGNININKLLAYQKITKNKKLKQSLFGSQRHTKSIRPKTTMANFLANNSEMYINCNNSTESYTRGTFDEQYRYRDRDQSMGSSSKYGIFIPVTKFRSNRNSRNMKSKQLKRYHSSNYT